ncbi:MAG: hypothetical protein H6727_10195 [Myxococcales bacterium]|nr:hypothetical protein [Myxococcales bacterium]
MPGRWRIQYDERTKQGRLCVEQARNNPLFLRGALPRDVVVEFDAYAQEKDGDVKIELFTDGRFHATGYVLVHGGWHNAMSIIDRLGEHNRDCRGKEQNQPANCRRWTRKQKVVMKKRHHWKVVRHDNKLMWYLDGKLFMRYDDPQPLEGKGHGFFAFSNWIAHVCYDNLSIRAYTPPLQKKSSAAPLVAPAKAAPIPRAVEPEPKAPTPQPVQEAPKAQPAPPLRAKFLLQNRQPVMLNPNRSNILRIHPNRLGNYGIQQLRNPIGTSPGLQIKRSKTK